MVRPPKGTKCDMDGCLNGGLVACHVGEKKAQVKTYCPDCAMVNGFCPECGVEIGFAGLSGTSEAKNGICKSCASHLGDDFS